jgi:hypothetical protein
MCCSQNAVYTSLLRSILGDSWAEPVEQDLLAAFLDMQWADYLASRTPERYHEEMRGSTAGGLAAGVEGVEVGTILSRGLVLANLPGSLSDLVYVLDDEEAHPNTTATTTTTTAAVSPARRHMLETLDRSRHATLADYAAHLEQHWNPLSCSMIGIWGSRTTGGELYTGRNLDWESDTGINAYKLVTVYRPDNATAHVTMGFGSLIGALTGMSAKGLTVHEANLEEKPESFR